MHPNSHIYLSVTSSWVGHHSKQHSRKLYSTCSASPNICKCQSKVKWSSRSYRTREANWSIMGNTITNTIPGGVVLIKGVPLSIKNHYDCIGLFNNVLTLVPSPVLEPHTNSHLTNLGELNWIYPNSHRKFKTKLSWTINIQTYYWVVQSWPSLWPFEQPNSNKMDRRIFPRLQFKYF